MEACVTEREYEESGGVMSIIGFNIAALGKPVQIPLWYGNNNIGGCESDLYLLLPLALRIPGFPNPICDGSLLLRYTTTG